MTIQKLASSDAFIIFDLDGAPAAGIVRSAPKVLVSGATMLARSLTYRFAAFGRQVGGASSGINATAEARSAAVAAYLVEVEPMVRAGRLSLDAGRGVADTEVADLRASDPRPEAYWSSHLDLTGVGIAVSADVAAGGLDGRSVAIEGFDRSGPALVEAISQRGGKVVAVSTSAGAARSPGGMAPDLLADAWREHGPGMVESIGGDPIEALAIFGVESDILVVGSKPGVVDHDVAGGMAAQVVVAGGAVPVTAKGLAVLRRAGRVLVPDFVSTAGPMFAGWPEPDDGDPAVAATRAITAVLTELRGEPDGLFLGACRWAESYLRTWRDPLPFGRPLA